ncbi:hypothetical protein GCM10010174_37240 [Kutzneria viridogrisea]|uniref:Uncharacterized protein n=1 Tax=Kutzneria viridogrisea TaxID=47990 RepID=A0ABR6BU01_9PSEU|nr:hypothetical protein [Kutzneria viridogrisea]
MSRSWALFDGAMITGSALLASVVIGAVVGLNLVEAPAPRGATEVRSEPVPGTATVVTTTRTMIPFVPTKTRSARPTTVSTTTRAPTSTAVTTTTTRSTTTKPTTTRTGTTTASPDVLHTVLPILP